MTYGELLHAWAVIEKIAEQRGITPAEVREDIKAAITATWAEEEHNDYQPLHNDFPNGVPSVEAALVFLTKLTQEALGL